MIEVFTPNLAYATEQGVTIPTLSRSARFDADRILRVSTM